MAAPAQSNAGEPRGIHERSPHRLTHEDRETALQLVSQLNPEMVEPLKQAMEESPERVERVLRERFPRLDRMLQLRRYDPEMFDLRVADLRAGQQALVAARALRDAKRRSDDQAVEEHQASLRLAVAEHFDVRRRLRELELERMELRIAELREEIDREADQRDDRVAQRVVELSQGDLPKSLIQRGGGPAESRWKPGKRQPRERDGASFARPYSDQRPRDTTAVE